MKLWTLIFLFYSTSIFAMTCEEGKIIETLKPQFSKSFSIIKYAGYKIVSSNDQKYLLADKKPACETNAFYIHTPVKNVVMTSTTHLPSLEILSETNSLKGFQGKNYIVSKAFSLNSIKEVSFKFNPEELIKLNPDLVMGYVANLMNEKQLSLLHKLKIPVVLNGDYLETSPLARAEWILFNAAFYNKEETAKDFFNNIVSNYQSAKIHTAKKTKVLVGEIQNGFWITCGEKSDLGQMISDAGGELVLSSDKTDTQKVSMEVLLSKVHKVDVWLPQNTWTKRSQIDDRYKFLKAKNIFNNNKILNAKGANDYWEMGMQRPDLLLKDLVKIFQSGETESLNWFQKL